MTGFLSAKNKKFIKNTIEELFLGHHFLTHLNNFWSMGMLKFEVIVQIHQN